MKIGILTLPLHTNYGGILQAYALQKTLECMGGDAMIINRLPCRKILWHKMLFVYMKRVANKYILGRNIKIFRESYFNRTYPIVSQYTQGFVDKYVRYIYVDDLSSLSEKDFDTIIVGSDQIWRPKYYSKIEDAYLAFAEKWKVNRIAYAVSFGTDQWEYTKTQTANCKRLVKKFDLVSVREDSGVSFCKEYFNVIAIHVLDPTMLLSVDNYVEIIRNSNTLISNGTLLCYILNKTEEHKKLIKSIAADNDLVPFHVDSKVEEIYAPLEERIQLPVEQWLRGFLDAKFVVTDSFHACVFSILFNKPFVVCANEGRGLSRIQSLLSMFALEDCLLASYEDYGAKNYDEIDWTSINLKISEFKIQSINLLRKALSF